MKATRKRYSADFKGKVALVAIRSDLMTIMDWATRKVLASRLSNTMKAGFCVAAREEALP